MFRGYSAGAVDYLFKPFDPEVLRSKVAVFIELHRKNGGAASARASCCASGTSPRSGGSSEDRYRQLADAMPQIVWAADRDGRATYYNRRWFEYTGQTVERRRRGRLDARRAPRRPPCARSRGARRRSRRARPSRSSTASAPPTGRIAGISAARCRSAARTARSTSGSARRPTSTTTSGPSRRSASSSKRASCSRTSLDYLDTLEAVARAAVPAVADWAAVHIVERRPVVLQVALAHVDPQKIVFAEELQERYPPNEQSARRRGDPHRRRRSSCSELTDEMLRRGAVDELHYELIRELGARARSSACRSPSRTACSARSRWRPPSPAAATTRPTSSSPRSSAGAPRRRSRTRGSTRRPTSGRRPRGCSRRSPTASCSSTRRGSCGSGTRRPRGSRAAGRRRARAPDRRSRPRLGAARAADPGRDDPGTAAPRRRRSSSAAASSGSPFSGVALRGGRGLRLPRPDRGARARADAVATSSPPSRTSCARRSRRSTAPR